MARFSLKVPPFQVYLGTNNISEAIVGFSVGQPLFEPSTPSVWTGSIQMFPVRSGQPRSFFDDEVNPQYWLSGLLPIDFYFEESWWQRFRVKPNGYRFNQDTGEAEIQFTDILGLLNEYQPSADAPEFKTGENNAWNTLAVALIKKQAGIMGISVSVETPDYGIGGNYQVPRSIRGSYVKAAQQMAGERGQSFWCDKEVIKCEPYNLVPTNIVWAKSRAELFTFNRQQGLDPAKAKVTVTATHEAIDSCNDKYPRRRYTYASSQIATNTAGTATNNGYQIISSIIDEDRVITGVKEIKYTKKVVGNPALILFGGQLTASGDIKVNIPDAAGYTIKKLGGYDWWLSYTKNKATFNWNWQTLRPLLDQTDVSVYEDVPYDSLNNSKLLSKTVTKSEPWAKFSAALQYFDTSRWFNLNVSNDSQVTEKTVTNYTYRQIFRNDVVTPSGIALYEIATIEEIKYQVYFLRQKVSSTITNTIPLLAPMSRVFTQYEKECVDRWKVTTKTQTNNTQSATSMGFLFDGNTEEDFVNAIPAITYRPYLYPVFQQPLLGYTVTNYAQVSPFVVSNEFNQAETLTSNAECTEYSKLLAVMKLQRYQGREISTGYSSNEVLNFRPYRGVYANAGLYTQDRWGMVLNLDGDGYQLAVTSIGNKVALIAPIPYPLPPHPPLLSVGLAIGAISDKSFIVNLPILAIAPNIFGGLPPYTFSSTTLPDGLTIDPATGVISGTPTTIAALTGFTVTVTDAAIATASTEVNIAIEAPPTLSVIHSNTLETTIKANSKSKSFFLSGLALEIKTISRADSKSRSRLGSPLATSTIRADTKSSSRFLRNAEKANANDLTRSKFNQITIRANNRIIQTVYVSPPDPSANTLLPKTIAYFSFDDESGGSLYSYDLTGDYRLVFSSYSAIYTENGAIGNAIRADTGHIAVLEPAFGGSLNTSIWDLRLISFIGIAFKVYLPSGISSTENLINMQGSTLAITVDSTYQITAKITDSFSTNISTTFTETLDPHTWYSVEVEVDLATQTIKLNINNGVAVSSSGTLSTLSSFVSFYVYSIEVSSDYSYIDELYIHSAALGGVDSTALYNSGRGLQYPFDNSLKTLSLSYFAFDNTSEDSAANPPKDKNQAFTLVPNTSDGYNYTSGIIGNSIYFNSAFDVLMQVSVILASINNLPSQYDPNITGFIGHSFWIYPILLVGSDTTLLYCYGQNYGVSIDSSGNIYAWIYIQDGSYQSVTFGDFPISDSAWYLVNLEVNISTGVLQITVNDGNLYTHTGFTGIYNAPLTPSINLVQQDVSSYSQIQFDELWNYRAPLSAAQRTQLYNGGAGLQYPF